MNLADIVSAVAEDTQLPKTGAEKATKAVLAAVIKGLKKDGEVAVVGFGSFKVQKRKARKGRNPATGEDIQIKASKTVRFRPGKTLKDAI